MEEELIGCVRANPILYDLKNKQYRNPVARKEAWDKIGAKLGMSGDLCKEAWNKLRNAYTNAINRRKTKSGQAAKKMVKWTFEDQMTFLALTVVPPKTHSSSSGISQDEIQEQDDDANDHKVVKGIADDTQPSQPQNFNKSLSTDQLDIVSPQHSSTFRQCVTPEKDSKTKSTRIEATMSELVSIMKNNSRMRSQYISRNQSTVSKTCVHDEEEMFFLSLAKFTKKLNPAERIRVKSEVSQVVFQAEYRNLQNSEHYSEQCQFSTASPANSEQSLFS